MSRRITVADKATASEATANGVTPNGLTASATGNAESVGWPRHT